MREVNNNTGISSQGAQRTPNFKGVDKNDLNRPSNISSQGKEINGEDLRNTPAEVVGRSQVPTKVDNLENDIKILSGNPKLVEDALKLSDIAVVGFQREGLSKEAATEKALKVAKSYVEEFSK